MRRTVQIVFVALMLALAGCGGDKEEAPATTVASDGETVVQTEGNFAQATIEPKSGSTLSGMAIFSESDGQVTLELSVEGAPAGTELAAHIHENGDCSAPDGSSAGGHWNPNSEDHGKWGDGAHHLGDLGNIETTDSGLGVLELTTERWSIGTGDVDDVVGKSIIVHESADDFTTQPTGAAGGRIGCGVIEKK